VQRLSISFGITPDDREESATNALHHFIMCGLESQWADPETAREVAASMRLSRALIPAPFKCEPKDK
jgi:hypothetical protein